MSPPGNREEPLIRRLARSKAMNSRNASRDTSMSPTRYDNNADNLSTPRSSSQPPTQQLKPGSYYTNENGQIVQYVPCTFIYPNNSNVSISLPSLNIPNNIPENIRPQISQFPQRRLSKLSNLCWTTSVSQPDLTRPITTPTMSPSNSLPTSRASSPVPPSISARGSPGNGPSPHVSPMGSGSIYNQDIYHLNAALNQLGSSQGYIFPPQHYGVSSNTSEQRNANLQPLQDLNGNQANYQAQPGQPTNLLAPNLINLPTAKHDVTAARQRQDTYHTNGLPQNGHFISQPDTSVWYCQYVSVPNSESLNVNHGRPLSPEAFQVPTEFDHSGRPLKNDKRCNSSSPQRVVTLSSAGTNCKKPCAVIAPHLVQTEKRSNQQLGHNVQSSRPIATNVIRNSSPVPSIKVDNEFGLSSSAPAQNHCWTYQTSTADISDDYFAAKHKLAERSQGQNNCGSCPDINYTHDNSFIGSNKRSIGTSCSDLEKPLPLVVETCQICNLFQPKSESAVEEASLGNPYYTYSPCLYGHKVMVNPGTSQLRESEPCASANEVFPQDTNKLDNRPDMSVAVKKERNFKVQSARQETKEKGRMEQIKSASGAGQGSIDNRIEQAMDLVKSHLMSAVRSEVEELRDKISKLEDTVTILSRENEVLRANVNPEVLASLTGNRNLVGGMNSISNLPCQPPDPAIHPALQPPNQH